MQSATRDEIKDPRGHGTTVAESFVLIPLPRYCEWTPRQESALKASVVLACNWAVYRL